MEESGPFSLSTIRKNLISVAFLVLFSACGFHLRQPVELPPGMNKVYVEGISQYSPFLSYFYQAIRLSDGHLTSDLASAGLVLNVLDEQLHRREVSLSESGKANEYELSYGLIYEVRTPEGEIISPRQTIYVLRDYFNPQINVIGKSEEEHLIRQEMYKEAVRTLLRRTQIALRKKFPSPK